MTILLIVQSDRSEGTEIEMDGLWYIKNGTVEIAQDRPLKNSAGLPLQH